MRRVGFDEYLEYAGRHGYVEAAGQRYELRPITVTRIHPLPGELGDTSTTVWSFPRRGSWATHRGDYRGNWPPQVPRALIEMYTEPGDTVLDPMVGGGTTCIEAVLLARNCIGVDISYGAVILTLHRLYWLRRHLEKIAGRRAAPWAQGQGPSVDEVLAARVEVYHGDARSLDAVGDGEVDAVLLHPPYHGIIRYGGGPGDLSAARSLGEYLAMLRQVLAEARRTLRPGGVLAVLVGDTRERKRYVPITHHVLRLILETGFTLREEIVKVQHNMRETREKWAGRRDRGFLLIRHEKLYVAEKD